jgi:DNA polymerase III subunit gamma/tau
MVVHALGEVPAELQVTPEQDERLAAQAEAVAPADVLRLLDMIAAALRALKDGADARTQLELALVKAAQPEHDPSAKALLARIERLEARLGSKPPPPASRAPSEPATAAGRASGRTHVAVSAQVEDQPPVAASTTLPGAPDGGAPDAQTVADQAAADVSADLATDADPKPAVTAVAVVEPDAPAPDPAFEFSREGFEQVWPAVLETLEADSPRTAELLRQATPMEVAASGLTLAWPESAAFYKRQAEDPDKRELIAQSIRAVTGASLRLVYELRADEDIASPAEETLSDDELVDRFKREFSAVEEPPPSEET